MKKQFYFIYLGLIVSFFIFQGFQCSSTELTSARLYIQQKNLEKAEKVLNDEVKKNPQSEEGFYLLGFINFEKKNWTDMTSNFNKALAIDKKHEVEIKNYIKSAWAENFNDGVKNFSIAAKKTDKDSLKLFMDRAINNFKTGIELQPDSAETYKNLAFCYLNLNDLDAAIDPLDKYVKKSNALDGYAMLGEIYFRKAEQNLAKYQTSKAVEDSVAAQKYFKDVIILLEKGVLLHPASMDLNTLLFSSYIATGQKEFALEKSLKAYEKTPDDKAVNYNLGTLLLEMKRYGEAEKYLKKSIELDPKNENGLYNLIANYINWGVKVREDEAEKPEEQRTYKQYFERAIPYLEKMTELKPDDPKLWTKLAQVYANLDKKDKAKEAFDKADQLIKQGK